MIGLGRVPPVLPASCAPEKGEEAGQCPRAVRVAVARRLDQLAGQPVGVQLDVVLEARREQVRHAVRDPCRFEPRFRIARSALQEQGKLIQQRQLSARVVHGPCLPGKHHPTVGGHSPTEVPKSQRRTDHPLASAQPTTSDCFVDVHRPPVTPAVAKFAEFSGKNPCSWKATPVRKGTRSFGRHPRPR